MDTTKNHTHFESTHAFTDGSIKRLSVSPLYKRPWKPPVFKSACSRTYRRCVKSVNVLKSQYIKELYVSTSFICCSSSHWGFSLPFKVYSFLHCPDPLLQWMLHQGQKTGIVPCFWLAVAGAKCTLLLVRHQWNLYVIIYWHKHVSDNLRKSRWILNGCYCTVNVIALCLHGRRVFSEEEHLTRD